jgi:hypothetical protein
MNRKYRHSGYQDRDDDRNGGDRDRKDRPQGGPQNGPRVELTKEQRIHKRSLRHALDRSANEVVRCYSCGRDADRDKPITQSSCCRGCSIDLHCCRFCKSFDSSARFQCRETIETAVPNKTKANDCTKFQPRLVLDSSGRRAKKQEPRTSRSAFDDLFKTD